jgi:hypothetical protein
LLISFFYLALRKLIELVALRPRSAEYKELEIVVFGTSSPSCAVKSRDRICGRPIASSSRRRPGFCPGGDGRRSLSPRRLCSPGIDAS